MEQSVEGLGPLARNLYETVLKDGDDALSAIFAAGAGYVVKHAVLPMYRCDGSGS